MSKKDYEAIAAILAGELACSDTSREMYRVVGITFSLADYFARENKLFDRAKFYAAVGIPNKIGA